MNITEYRETRRKMVKYTYLFLTLFGGCLFVGVVLAVGAFLFEPFMAYGLLALALVALTMFPVDGTAKLAGEALLKNDLPVNEKVQVFEEDVKIARDFKNKLIIIALVSLAIAVALSVPVFMGMLPSFVLLPTASLVFTAAFTTYFFNENVSGIINYRTLRLKAAKVELAESGSNSASLDFGVAAGAAHGAQAAQDPTTERTPLLAPQSPSNARASVHASTSAIFGGAQPLVLSKEQAAASGPKPSGQPVDFLRTSGGTPGRA